MQLGSSLLRASKKAAAAADEALGSAQLVGPVQVARRSDMDMNGHINNATYLAWALETVPSDVYLNYSLQQVSVQPMSLFAVSMASPVSACLPHEVAVGRVQASHEDLTSWGMHACRSRSTTSRSAWRGRRWSRWAAASWRTPTAPGTCGALQACACGR